MVYAVYIAAVLGALAVYLILPHGRSWGKVGALLGLAALAGFIVLGLREMTADQAPGFFYYTFTVIAIAAAVRVITHARPVYSALYFVMVVLSSAGLLVLLQAEFMAFAMVIIYGGAILVTYMFVIMLATLPVSSKEPDTAAEYDTHAREPLLAAVMGFALIAAMGNVLFAEGGLPEAAPTRDAAVARVEANLRAMPGKFDSPSALAKLESVMKANGLIEPNEKVKGVDVSRGFDEGQIEVVTPGSADGGESAQHYVAFDADLLNEVVANIDFVGLNLFQTHTLGIELAGVILLMAMVGAIVIAQRKLPHGSPPDRPTSGPAES
ncbi:MAG: hypothetical protein GC159_02320 [Phycisphaera sp.]|nr:hypothetical protein [Phycisphaera sp.]